MRRKQIEDLIYSGRMARRFTQDSPILPDVWIKYAEEPGEAHEVLLTPHLEPGPRYTTPGALSVVVRERLERERKRPADKVFLKLKRSRPHISYNASTVVVALWFDELIRVILPLSEWWEKKVVQTGLINLI